jgi:putative copper resistance protein D
LLGSGAIAPGRSRVRSAAAASALLWAALTVLQIGLLSWELSGRSDVVDSVRFRALVIQLALALACAIGWKLGGRRPVSIAATCLSLLALLPVVLAGHPRSADHPLVAGISVSAHTIGAALWIGGLAAIAWLAAAGDGEWTAALPRYSQLALVCVVVLTLSGVVTAVGRLSAPGRLFTSHYGAIVLLKAVLLMSLVAAGWMQRRYVFTRAPISRGHFLAIAGLELTTMTLALALAVALARTPPPV